MMMMRVTPPHLLLGAAAARLAHADHLKDEGDGVEHAAEDVREQREPPGGTRIPALAVPLAHAT